MNILVCAATGDEMNVIKSNIKNLNIIGLSVHFLTTGMGNHETAFSLTKYLLTCPDKPDLLLNIGVCGWVGEKVDIVQVARIVYASTGKESIVPLPLVVAPVKTCFCSETPVFEKLLAEESYVVDMECFAVDFIGQKFQIPRIILKVAIDEVGEETKHFDRKASLELLGKTIIRKELLEKIATTF